MVQGDEAQGVQNAPGVNVTIIAWRKEKWELEGQCIGRHGLCNVLEDTVYVIHFPNNTKQTKKKQAAKMLVVKR